MDYQINWNDINHNIPIPPAPRACTTYTLMQYFWKTIEFVNFVTRVLPDHVNRPLDITVIPEKFDPNEIEEGKFLGIITKYRPKNFLTDLEIQYAKRDIIFDEFFDNIKSQED